jgi:hypothetical protein
LTQRRRVERNSQIIQTLAVYSQVFSPVLGFFSRFFSAGSIQAPSARVALFVSIEYQGKIYQITINISALYKLVLTPGPTIIEFSKGNPRGDP